MARRRGRRRGRKGPVRRAARPDPSGTISIKRRGYGFVETNEGEFFVSQRDLHGAMDGDRVIVSPVSGDGRRRRARVVHVLVRSHDTVVGTYEENQGLGVVVPADTRISFDFFVDASSCPDVHTGDVVRARIVAYPTRHTAARAFVEEVVGRDSDADIAQRVLVASHDVETVFSDQVLDEARAAKLDVAAALAQPGRRDLRDRHVFTIDPVDARDFDDAISVEELDEGKVRLGVHIADVSHYVPWNSALDLAARRRSTSVYLVDRVIPMLPEELSCDLCSLKPGCDRLAFTVDVVLDATGAVVATDLYPSVIRSRARLDYEQVQRFLDGDGCLSDPRTERGVSCLAEIADGLRARRVEHGAIDFDGEEPHVALDDQGRVVQVLLRHRTRATGAIEEAMILANRVVARHMHDRGVPMVYRIHEAPALESVARLKSLLLELSYPVDGLMELQPRAFQDVLARAAERPERELVTNRVLRSMKRAVYRTDNLGHFGLAADAYTHFTSPIRRYPDLVAHRLLKAQLCGCFATGGDVRTSHLAQAVREGEDVTPDLPKLCDSLGWICEHASGQERVAAEIESSSVQIKLCEYLADHVGETYPGVVTGVSNSGLYVMLPIMVKGLVPMRSLGQEYFVVDAEHQTLTGEDSGRVLRIGMQVRVTLKAVSPSEQTVDLELS